MKTEQDSEVEVLDEKIQWDHALAFRIAYEIHRVIGNNIGHYRKDTEREIVVAIRNAVKRNSEPKDIANEKLAKLIREAVKARPDLDPQNDMRMTRTEMLDGKPVRCYIEK